MTRFIAWRGKRLAVFVLVLLLIEFMDEFVFSIREATLPLIRDAYALDYIQLGILLTVPRYVANLIEPFIGILGDTGFRKRLIITGGIFFALMMLAIAMSNSFLILLLAFIILYPASGAFVSLSQASLMDYEPERHEQNMARWTFFGSLGLVFGPLALSAALGLAFDWRMVYVFLAILTVPLIILAWRILPQKAIASSDEEEEENDNLPFWQRLASLKKPMVIRWLLLLQASDLMLDILLAYLSLYFVDVVGVSPAEAAFALTVWTGVGLVGDFFIIFLLERVPALRYLRYSAVLELLLYSGFLLIDNWLIKLVFLGLLGFFNAGWYSVLQGRLYSALPNQSGLALTASNIGEFFGGFIPLLIGFVAQKAGLGIAMWIMALGPIVILLGLPNEKIEADE